jgi:hypothetical protein
MSPQFGRRRFKTTQWELLGRPLCAGKESIVCGGGISALRQQKGARVTEMARRAQRRD